jgi:hypothetical protein
MNRRHLQGLNLAASSLLKTAQEIGLHPCTGLVQSMRQPIFYESSLKPPLLSTVRLPTFPSAIRKTLKTFPKTSQGNPEHQRLIKQATV